MNIYRLTIALLVSSAFCQTAAPAQETHAGFKNSHAMVNTSGLPQVTFHHSPLRLQVLNEQPTITDCTRPDQSGQNFDGMRVPINQTRAGTAGGAAIPGSFGSAGPVAPGVSFGRGNAMVPGLGSLPASAFESKLPGHRMLPLNALPNGTSVGQHVVSRLSPTTAARRTERTPANSWQPAPSPQQVVATRRYNDTVVSVGSSGGLSASTSVSGALKTPVGTRLLERVH
jgi:hypothetical protein